MSNRGGLPAHEPFPMRVGLDVDDVLLDLMTRWLELYNEEWDDNLDKRDVSTWDIFDHVLPMCGKRIYEFLTPDIYLDVAPLDGAAEFVQVIRDMGHIPVYVSSCGPAGIQQHATATAKINLLIDSGIGRREEHFIASSNKTNAPVDLLLDDGFHNVEAFQNGLAVIFDQPWNHHIISPYPRARNYDQALTFIDIYARHRSLCEDFSSP